MKRFIPIAVFMTVLRFTSYGQVTIQDSLALVSFYNATGGDQWTNNTNWLNGPVGEWYGVTLEGHRVLMLKMDDNGLAGFIPDAIGTLTGLVELSIGNSVFQGSIPESIGQLASLYELNIRNSGLTGQIPEALGNCNQLTSINLSRNMLEGPIPASLSQCTLLRSIQLQSNVLSGGFPMLFLSLPQLRSFDISSNQFTGMIPPEINEINGLTGMYLSENLFEGPFPKVDNLTLLEGLNIAVNSFSGDLDTILGYYPEMRNLHIHDNQFTGLLSPVHFVPEKMNRIWAFNNHLSGLGVFADWVNHPGFVNIYVSRNDLDFDDLLPNSSMPANKFLCAPQNPIGRDTTIYLLPGEAYTIYSPMQDEEIQYQWYFNSELISGVENYDLIIDPFTPQLAGDFLYIATHASLPNVELVSATTTLEEATTAIASAGESHFHMYPNPTRDDVVLISAPEALPYHIRLYSANGHLLQTRIVQDLQSNISLLDYPSGLYLLHMTTSKGTILSRISKQ